MQILFFLGLIGIIFTTMTFINASVTVTAMQKKLDQIENVNKLFSDVEFAVNKGFLVTEPDLSLREVAGDFNDMTFASSMVKWNIDELQTDPWGTDYVIITNSELQTIYADAEGLGGGNNQVQAYVTAFALVSAGADGVFGNGNPPNPPVVPWPATYAETRAYTPARPAAEGEDDIFLTFTTFSAAVNMWNRVKETHDKVKSLASNHYTEQLELFEPQIATYYNGLDLDSLFDPDAGAYTFDESAWQDDGTLLANPNYPTMTTSLEELGAASEAARLPAGFLSFNLQMNAAVSNSETIDISLQNLGAGVTNNWVVVYGNEVEGATLSVAGP